MNGRLFLDAMVVVVGLLQATVLAWQACVFGQTLKAINRQASIMREQAGELVNAERAWLLMRPDVFTLAPSRRFDWLITNAGRTTARIVETQVICKKVAGLLPEIPDYGDPITVSLAPIAPQESLKFWSYIEAQPRITDGLADQDIREIENGQADLVAYGSVKYLDSFGRHHESRFCYYYALFCGEFRMNLRAPDEYHKCT